MVLKNHIKLNLGGKERVCHLGMGFLGMFLEATKSTIDDIGDKISDNPFKTIPELVFHSMAYAQKRVGQNVDFTIYEVADWIDEAGGLESESLKVFMDAFIESLNKGTKQPENEPKNVQKTPVKRVGRPKKKQTGTKT